MDNQLDLFRAEGASPDPARTAPVVARSHGPEQSMTEFAQWAMSAFGTLDLRAALEQAAFMICCDVIAQDISKAPLRLREWLPNGVTSRVVLPNEHPVAAFLANEPNERHTWVDFCEMMVLWHAITKNSYAACFRNNLGQVMSMVPVQSGRVMAQVVGKEVFYDFHASTLQEQALLGASFLRLPERDVVHVRGRMLDGMDGYSTLRAGRQTLETAQAIGDYRKSLFGEDGQLRGVFTRDKDAGELPEVAFQRLRSQFRQMMSRFRELKEPIVLEGGLKFDAISANPQEAELTEQFEAQIVETCRLLRVPPHKVFHLANVKYENLETMEKAYVSDTLVPVCQRHEQRYKKAMLISEKDRNRFFIEHDRDALQIKDTKAETDRVMRGIERGVLEINEGRAKLGWNPIDGGDVRLIPANMRVVDRNGKVLIEASSSGSAPKDSTDSGDGGDNTDNQDDNGEGKTLRLVVNH